MENENSLTATCNKTRSLTCGKGGWGATYPLFWQNLLNKMVIAEALLNGFLGVYIDGNFCPDSFTFLCISARL